MSNHEHEWQLTEAGYVRKWLTEVDEATKTITAYWGGSEDFSDGGDGMSTCCAVSASKRNQ